MLPKSTKNSTFKAESNQSKDNVISGGVVENNCVKIGKGGKSLPSKGKHLNLCNILKDYFEWVFQLGFKWAGW